jgi:hypothetical protein
MSLPQLLGGLLPLAGTAYVADDLKKAGESFATDAETLKNNLSTDFDAYGTVTGTMPGDLMKGAKGTLGSAAGMAAAGSTNPLLGRAQMDVSTGQNMLSGNAQNSLMGQAMAGMGGYQQNALGSANMAMQNAMGDTGAREQQIFDRAMAMQNPQLDRAQAAQQAREYAMGRGGIRGSQFGGTAEDAAMARARAEAMNNASFAAMGQAQTEMTNQGNLASQFGQLGNQAANTMNTIGYQNAQLGQNAGQNIGQLGIGLGQLGNQQTANAVNAAGTMGQIGGTQGQLGIGVADQIQTGQLTGAGYDAQLGLGGIQAELEAKLGAGSNYASMFSAMADQAPAIAQTTAGAVEDITDWLDGLLGKIPGL